MPELLPTHRLAMPAFQVALGTPVVSEALSPGELMRSAANAYRVTEATTAAEVFLQDVATMEVRSCTTEYMLEGFGRASSPGSVERFSSHRWSDLSSQKATKPSSPTSLSSCSALPPARFCLRSITGSSGCDVKASESFVQARN